MSHIYSRLAAVGSRVIGVLEKLRVRVQPQVDSWLSRLDIAQKARTGFRRRHRLRDPAAGTAARQNSAALDRCRHRHRADVGGGDPDH